MNIELTILDFIQEYIRNALLDVIMPAVSTLGNAGIIWILLTIVLLVYKKTRRTGAILAAALLVDVFLCNGLIKPLVARTRPFVLNPSIKLLVTMPKDYSFPSGHTAASFASVTALFLAREKLLWKPALILACLIAFSRLYLYVHFPTDVLAGIILGILAGVAGYLIVKGLENRIQNHKKERTNR